MIRLKSKKEYRRLSQCTQKTVGRYFIVVYLFDSMILEPLVGITVSKKVGNAVVRNKVKRRIRAFLRAYIAPVSKAGFLCNVIALPSAVNADWESFQKDLKNRIDCVFRALCPHGIHAVKSEDDVPSFVPNDIFDDAVHTE